MTVSDKIVLILGIATILTMLVAGWVGEKAWDAFMASRRKPKPNPDEDEANSSIRRTKRKRFILPVLLIGEGMFVILVGWYRSRHSPMSYGVLVGVSAGISAILFGALLHFIMGILDLLDEHVRFMDRQWETQRQHLLLTRELAEVAKKDEGGAK
jgi:hypothetical protein